MEEEVEFDVEGTGVLPKCAVPTNEVSVLRHRLSSHDLLLLLLGTSVETIRTDVGGAVLDGVDDDWRDATATSSLSCGLGSLPL